MNTIKAISDLLHAAKVTNVVIRGLCYHGNVSYKAENHRISCQDMQNTNATSKLNYMSPNFYVTTGIKQCGALQDIQTALHIAYPEDSGLFLMQGYYFLQPQMPKSGQIFQMGYRKLHFLLTKSQNFEKNNKINLLENTFSYLMLEYDRI